MIIFNIFRVFTSFIDLQISGKCPGTYDNATAKYIISPNYPQQYDMNGECSWGITNFMEKAIHLYFDKFKTKYPIDVLTIYEGGSPYGKKLYWFSGTSIPSKKTIVAKSLYITFEMEASGETTSTNKGFRMWLVHAGK